MPRAKLTRGGWLFGRAVEIIRQDQLWREPPIPFGLWNKALNWGLLYEKPKGRGNNAEFQVR
jgi:hypothetical protein